MRFSLADLDWQVLDEDVQAHTRRLVRDVVACAAAGAAHTRYEALAPEADLSGGATAAVWFHGKRTFPSYAALVNGSAAHYADMDDGHAGASVHGGVSVVPAAVAVAESEGAAPEACLAAIVAGYATAIAFGRPMRESLERERAHPPAVVGGLGAAAAAAKLLGLDEGGILDAVTLARCLAPLAPFESFTRGATVKALYGGWPAHIGVEAALLARDGFCGPRGYFAPVERDGVDPRDITDVYLKRWASCRATHAALTACASLLPLDASRVQAVLVETYEFACELSGDADATTPIGAQASIPATIACLLLEGRVDPWDFTEAALAGRDFLADKVEVRAGLERREARVTVLLDDGSRRTAHAPAPADEGAPEAKFDRLMKGKTLDVELLRALVA